MRVYAIKGEWPAELGEEYGDEHGEPAGIVMVDLEEALASFRNGFAADYPGAIWYPRTGEVPGTPEEAIDWVIDNVMLTPGGEPPTWGAPFHIDVDGIRQA